MDLTASGGGVIRATGIMNALNNAGNSIVFFTPSQSTPILSKNIKRVELPKSTSQFNKRLFQFLIAFLPIPVLNLLFHKQLTQLRKRIPYKSNIIFFDYLDISIGYWLFKNNIIKSYIADIHGIAPLEFDLNVKKSFKTKFLNKLKKQVVIQLDKKVLKHAKYLLYSSKGVKSYLENLYNLPSEKAIVVPEAINQFLVEQKVNDEAVKQIQEQINYSVDDEVFLFAGKFKQLGGVVDLVHAFIRLKEEKQDEKIKLLLVGYGPLLDYCKKLVAKSKYNNSIYFFGHQPYQLLKTFQSVADYLVCPDQDTVFSQLLPHIKYFDAISSGKIVISGKFAYSDELNPNEKFSINFEPSDIDSLVNSMDFAINNKINLTEKAKLSATKAQEKFTYNNSIQKLNNVLNNKCS